MSHDVEFNALYLEVSC